MLHHKKNSKKLRVSFDFDDTLCLIDNPFDRSYSTSYDIFPNKEMIKKFLEYKNTDGIVYIVSSRLKIPDNFKDIRSFCELNKLDPEAIYLTDFDYKVNTLDALNIDIHYDDNIEEIEMIKRYAPQIETVHVKPSI